MTPNKTHLNILQTVFSPRSAIRRITSDQVMEYADAGYQYQVIDGTKSTSLYFDFDEVDLDMIKILKTLYKTYKTLVYVLQNVVNKRWHAFIPTVKYNTTKEM